MRSARQRAVVLAGVALALAIVGLALALGRGGGGAEETSGAGGSRSDEEGGVTVMATWDGSLSPAKFELALNTHSVDLDGYDLSRLVVLRVNGGSEVAPVSTDQPKGGHHRSATLTFDWPVARASQAGASTVELVVRGVGGKAERVLRWEPAGE